MGKYKCKPSVDYTMLIIIGVLIVSFVATVPISMFINSLYDDIITGFWKIGVYLINTF